MRLGLNGGAQADPAELDGTYGRLLVAGVALFAERGYEACTVRDIAAACGVKAPAIYNHYTSKLQILISGIDYWLKDFMMTVLDDLPPAQSPGDRLLEIARRHAIYRLTHREMVGATNRLLEPRFAGRVLPKEDSTRLLKMKSEYMHIVGELIQESTKASEINSGVMAMSCLNILESLDSWFRPEGALTVSQIVDDCCRIVGRICGVDFVKNDLIEVAKALGD
jgi:AcrR family transcriptional regulator